MVFAKSDMVGLIVHFKNKQGFSMNRVLIMAMVLVGVISLANAELIPTDGSDLVVGAEYFNGLGEYAKSYGVYLGGFTGNDKLESVITAINASNVVSVDVLTLVGKSDDKDGIVVAGEGLTGTWTSTAPVDFYTVKAGNGNVNKDYLSVSVWYVGSVSKYDGIWTTYGLTNNGGNQPTISHLSAFATETSSVPEPTTTALLGISLLLLGFLPKRKKR